MVPRSFTPLCFALILALAPWPVFAGHHLIDITEIYSDEGGTIQFIEMSPSANDENGLAPTRLIIQNADGTEEIILKNFIATFAELDAGETMLVATREFADAYPDVVPDFLFVEGFYLPLESGRLIFRQEGDIGSDPDVPDGEVDAIAYGDFTGAIGRFVAPAPALPSSGCALVRTTIAPWPDNEDDNSTDYEVGAATPKNNAGDTITIECPGTPPFSMQIHEVYSDPAGAAQFIELSNDAPGETDFKPVELVAVSADGGTETVIYDFTEGIPGLAAGGTILLGTAVVETELGVAPDFVLPDGAVPVDAGRIILRHEGPCTACEIDALAYGGFTGDNGKFGAPAVALPADGCSALARASASDDNSMAFVVDVATPENNAGATATLECPRPPLADFSAVPVAGSPPLEVDFTDLSTEAPTGWLWDFGDGDTSTAQNPTHIYETEGTFDVSLSATNIAGTTTVTQTGYITVTTSAPLFKRGNADGNGVTSSLNDAIYILKYGFTFGNEPPCLDAADANNAGGFGVLIDALYLLSWGFVGGPPPPSPGPTDCGVDPPGLSVGCETSPAACQ